MTSQDSPIPVRSPGAQLSQYGIPGQGTTHRKALPRKSALSPETYGFIHTSLMERSFARTGEAVPIAIPGVEVKSNARRATYEYRDNFQNGSRLGAGRQAGNAAVQRQSGLHRASHKGSNGSSYKGSPYLHPKRHDNSTGTARVVPNTRQAAHSETQGYVIASTPPPTKRKRGLEVKMNARHKIKITSEDESPRKRINDDPIEIDDSDQETQMMLVKGSTINVPDQSSRRGQLEITHETINDDTQTSPYFSGAEPAQFRQIHSSDDDEPYTIQPTPLTNTKPLEPIKHSPIQYDFELYGFGPHIQRRQEGWHIRISEEGFALIDPEGNEDKSYYIDSQGTETWVVDDKSHAIHVILKTPVKKYGSNKQVFFTLTDFDEWIRCTQMLQNNIEKGLFKKHRSSNDARTMTIRDSVHNLRHGPGAPISTSTPKTSPRVTRNSFAPSNLREPVRASETIYSAAMPSISPGIPIPLPKGRSDETNLLVDKDEVKASDTGWIATRSSTRAAPKDPGLSETLLVYPENGPNQVTLYENDLERLRPGEFLNDSIVDFYLKLNHDRLSEQHKNDAFIFNTFFYNRLNQKKKERGDKTSYDAVRRWTSKNGGVDLFSKKFVVIPINENFHWYLAVVVNLDKVQFGDIVDKGKLEPSFVDPDVDEDASIAGSVTVSAAGSPEQTTAVQPDIHVLDDSTMDYPSRSCMSQTPIPLDPSTFDFIESPTKPSLTDRLPAEEQAKISDPVDLGKLSIEDSQVEVITQPKARPSKAIYSRTGRHIPQDTPVIIIFDSLKTPHTRVYKVVRDYLAAEALDKKKEILNTTQFETCSADVPLQDNFCDCGLYLIQYADVLLSQTPKVLENLLHRKKFKHPENLTEHKKRSEGLWQISKIAQRRAEMVEEITALSKDWRERNKKRENSDDEGAIEVSADPLNMLG